MARNEKNRVTVSGTVSPALGEFLEDYRWQNRKNRSAVVGDALLEWAKGEGFTEPEAETGETPADADNANTDSSDAAPEPVGAKPAAKRVR